MDAADVITVVDGLEIFYLLLDGGPIACFHCGYIGRRWLVLCPACGCPMSMNGKENWYPGIDADYRAQRKKPIE